MAASPVFTANKVFLSFILIVAGAEIHLAFTIDTENQAGEHRGFSGPRTSMAFTSDFLHFVEDFLLYNRRMCPERDDLILNAIWSSFLVPDGIGVCFEIHSTYEVSYHLDNFCLSGPLPESTICIGLRLVFWGMIHGVPPSPYIGLTEKVPNHPNTPEM